MADGTSEGDLKAEIAALREALTVWCFHCWIGIGPRPAGARPAVVTLSWSDRRIDVCVAHLPYAVGHTIAMDHSSDRFEIDPGIEAVEQHPLLRLPPMDRGVVELAAHVCAAAREYLDEAAPNWRGETVRLDEAQRAALVARCHVR